MGINDATLPVRVQGTNQVGKASAIRHQGGCLPMLGRRRISCILLDSSRVHRARDGLSSYEMAHERRFAKGRFVRKCLVTCPRFAWINYSCWTRLYVPRQHSRRGRRPAGRIDGGVSREEKAEEEGLRAGKAPARRSRDNRAHTTPRVAPSRSRRRCGPSPR